MTASDENIPDPTPADVVAYLQGRASEEQTQSIRKAIEDPDSQLHEWLRGTRQWAKRALPGSHLAGVVRHEDPTKIASKLGLLTEFVHRKKKDGLLTSEEVARIVSGDADEMTRLGQTPNMQELLTGMLTVLNQIRPQWAEDLSQLTSSRGR